jgi:osmoprotectant transport system permease protein
MARPHGATGERNGMDFLLHPANWDLTDPGSIPYLFLDHLYITGLTLLIGLLIAFPIAFLLVRYTRLNLPVQTTASILYTIPSFAFLGYMVGVTGFSLATILVPLVAYAQVVLIRNIVAAVRAVDPTLVDVGRAMGMNRLQLQRRVVLPLSLPIIVAGIRVVAVTTIGIATLGPYVGTQNLGTLIYDGIYLGRNSEIVAGAILITALAISVDLLLLGAQRLLNRGGQVSLA